jgi:hypothetical protein
VTADVGLGLDVAVGSSSEARDSGGGLPPWPRSAMPMTIAVAPTTMAAADRLDTPRSGTFAGEGSGGTGDAASVRDIA